MDEKVGIIFTKIEPILDWGNYFVYKTKSSHLSEK